MSSESSGNSLSKVGTRVVVDIVLSQRGVEDVIRYVKDGDELVDLESHFFDKRVAGN